MIWTVKHWSELTRDELYDLLVLRTAVFVVEQACPYQEVDGLDRRAWHVFARDADGKIAACLRVMAPEPGSDAAVIGRVVTAPAHRGTGLGRALLERGVQTAWVQTDARRILLHAQSYARGFYQKAGFRPTARPEFLEDNIPHLEMELVRKAR